MSARMNTLDFNAEFCRVWEGYTVPIDESGVLNLRQLAFGFWELAFEVASGIELNLAPLPETEGSCAHTESRVVDSRPSARSLRRRRECLRCHLRWTTYELYSPEIHLAAPEQAQT